jgi:bleomycin hydrolase
MKNISQGQLEQLKTSYQKKPVQNALRRVLVKNELTDLFEKQEQSQHAQFVFSNEIKTLPVTHQKQSGRCWIFAGLNVLREKIAKDYDLKTFELSQNYTAFWDKFEKINYFIEAMDDFLDVDVDDRTLQHLLKTGIQDGGQWDMFVSLVLKYGVVPMAVMPETKSSSNTRFMNQLINIKLRQYAANARRFAREGKVNQLPELKTKALDELYTFLVTNFGLPPQSFDFEYVDKKDNYNIVKNLTPQSFYKKHIGEEIKKYVSIIHAPTNDKPYLKTYTVAYLGNVVDGVPIKYLNLEMSELKDLVVKQILDEEVVWFGSDVARFGNRQLGVWDDQLFDYEQMLEMSLTMSKAEELDYAQGAMNHAMVITAINLDNGIPKRYKIQNSWGDANGQKGYFLGSDSWFDRYVYQAVIHEKHLTKEQLSAWKQEPIILKPWDPMGSLA